MSTPGSLAWLDGSDVSYSNWINQPETGAACGHIQRHAGCQWKATGNCSQELNFICQFGKYSLSSFEKYEKYVVFASYDNEFSSFFLFSLDSRRTIACEGQNATLQCGSGQVIEVEDAFYGRKTIHYCRSKLKASATLSQEECSWINVLDSVTGTVSSHTVKKTNDINKTSEEQQHMLKIQASTLHYYGKGFRRISK